MAFADTKTSGSGIVGAPAPLGRRLEAWHERLRRAWFARGRDHGGGGRHHAPAPMPPAAGDTRGPASEGVPLSEQEPGFRGTVVRVRGQEAIRRRLIEMGVTAGTEIEFERVAPLGDPLQVKVRGYHLSLRRAEARFVYVVG